MSIEYDNYLTEHRANVRKGFEWLGEHLPEILCYPNNGACQCKHGHDQSKYDSEEYEAYDQYFYGEYKTSAVKKAFNYAWLRHIHKNPHHWQHWVLINDEPDEGEIVLAMDRASIIEMICDWWSFSWKTGNLYEIFNWYEQHKEHIKLHDTTRNTVEDILNRIHARLDEINMED